MPHQLNKYCFVPWCESSSLCNPGKKFITVPKCEAERKKWFQAVGLPKQSFFKTFYCCEDHFDVNTDFEKWSKFHLLYGSTQFMLKKGVVPHRALVPEQPSEPCPSSEIDETPKKRLKTSHEDDVVKVDDDDDDERPDQDQSSTLPLALDQNSTSISHEDFNKLNEGELMIITVDEEDSASNYQPNQTESNSEEYVEVTDVNEVEVETTTETPTEPQTTANCRSHSSKLSSQKASYKVGKKDYIIIDDDDDEGNESSKSQQDQPFMISQNHIGCLLANGHVLPCRPVQNESGVMRNENGGGLAEDCTTTSPSSNPDSESDKALHHFKQAYNYCPYTNCQYHAPSRKGLGSHLEGVHSGKTKYEKFVPVGCTILEETVEEGNWFQDETSTCYESDCVCSYPDSNSDADDDECEMYTARYRSKYSCPYPKCKYYACGISALQAHINVMHLRISSVPRKRKSRPSKKVKTVVGLPTNSSPPCQPIVPISSLLNEDIQDTNFNISDQIICETEESGIIAAEEIVETQKVDTVDNSFYAVPA